MSESIVDKVKKRIGELEQAVQRLDFVKRHLNQNSSEIKGQIHTSISGHLETLRKREVWLLGQVDQVLVGKEEVLQRQQARLNKALGILHSSLAHHATVMSSGTTPATSSVAFTPSDFQPALMTSGRSGGGGVGTEERETAARHLVQALEELNSMELKAEETPYIAFRADQLALRESILGYGRVDANGMPLMLAFADDSKPSASLPRHVEEYEDTEHHVFYKELQDGTASSSNIRVSMPKLSSRVEDWLQTPMLHLTTSASAASAAAASASVDLGLRSPASETTVGTPLSQTTCAIQNWLSEIKHNPDGEDEDDFEIVDHSGSSHRESPVEEEAESPEEEEAESPEEEEAESPEEEEAESPEEEEAESPVEEEAQAPGMEVEEKGDKEFDGTFHGSPYQDQWLMNRGSVPSGSTAQEDHRSFFKHLPLETAVWLATARRQLQSLEKVGDVGEWFYHVPTDIATWLRTRNISSGDKQQPRQQQAQEQKQWEPDFFPHISNNKDHWLRKEQKEEKKEKDESGAGARNGHTTEVGWSDGEDDLDAVPFLSPTRPRYNLSSSSNPNRPNMPRRPDMGKEEDRAGASPAMEDWLYCQKKDRPLSQQHQQQAFRGVSGGSLQKPDHGAGLPRQQGMPRERRGLNPSAYWLVTPEIMEEMEAEGAAHLRLFAHISCKKVDWLLSEQSSTGRNSANAAQMIDLQGAARQSQNQWLMPTSACLTEQSTTPAYRCPLDHLIVYYDRLSISDWLLGGDGLDQRADSDTTDSSARSWSVLPESPPSSATPSLCCPTTSGVQVPPMNINLLFGQNSDKKQ